MTSAAPAPRYRVLTLLPTNRDSLLTAELLAREGVDVFACRTAAHLAEALDQGAGAVLLGEESLAEGALAVLTQSISDQPRWSDLPILLLTRSGPSSQAVGEAMPALGNVTLLERPLRVAGLVSTVRASLRARARQYQLQEHLEELERARQSEAAQVRRKDEFLAMLGHELRNPLAPIRNALGVLELDDSDPERRRRLRQMMLRQVEHLVRLVDDLLEASRLSQGKITLKRGPTDLRRVLTDAVGLAGRASRDPDTPQVRLSLPESPVVLQADPVRLAQVFGNLLNNAVRYGKPGGVVEVEARTHDREAVVTVRDDGVGIEADDLPHVFELFTQGRRDDHQLHDGLGIGLALVRRLVDMHGGSVEGRSDGKGLGAEFTVRLPLDPAQVNARVPGEHIALSGRDAGQRPLRIMVVDDNLDAGDSLCMLLEALGLSVESASDGEAALALAARFAPDVALLDVGMPGMDGYTLARRLRADPRHAGMVLAAMTGWGEERDRVRAREAGFDHHFSKPADIESLTRMLDGVAPRQQSAAPA
ncbi:MAG TPA: ATP-binding protein [Xanthomonadaceae bacterium]|nr:ATP-binding protein [Xanthomonadaceae bacterium]